MNNDIRLKVTFPTHRKTAKLIHLIGYEGLFSLLQLWCYTAQNHAKGVLSGYDKDDIEISAMWKGKKGEFLKAVIKVGFVKKINKGYEIHEWEVHNPYAFHAEERSELARKAAKSRWDKAKIKGLGDADSMQGAYGKHADSNTPSPTPLPSPTPKPIKTFTLDSTECQLSELLFNEILKRNPEHKKPNLQNWAKDIDKLIRLDNRTRNQIYDVIKWCQKDLFWQNNILSTSKLRDKYDQLALKMKDNSGSKKGELNWLEGMNK